MLKSKYVKKYIDEENPSPRISKISIVVWSFIVVGIFVLMLNFQNIVSGFITPVHLVKLVDGKIYNTTYATGKIQEDEKSTIQYNLPIVADDVFVELGDTVKIGDKIATVDFYKTKQAILNLISLTEMVDEDVLSSLYALNIDENMIDTLIPSEILADYDGVVSCVNVSKGNIVAPTESIAVISNLQSLEAILAVPENYADLVRVNQEVTLTVSALEGKKYTGVVSQISPVAHETLEGTSIETVVNVMVDIDNVDESLKAGYSTSAKIKVDEDEVVKTLPYEAINQDENNNEYVYVYVNGKTQKRYVETGKEMTDKVEVVSGINENEFVVLENTSVNDNQYVKVIKET